MEDKLLEKVDEKIQHIIDEDINTTNLEHLYKLTKIKHMTKEDKEMNYGNYGNYGNYSGRGPSRGSYGEGYGNYGEGSYGEYGRGSYGRRGRDTKYRGDDELDRMAGEYGRYQENRSRYGASEETDKAFYHMLEAYKNFGKVLQEEAETPQQKQMLREAIQSLM